LGTKFQPVSDQGFHQQSPLAILINWGYSVSPYGPIPQPGQVTNTKTKIEVTTMALIAAGASAPDFKLDSHLDSTVSLSEYQGSKNVLLVSYPLDFTPT